MYIWIVAPASCYEHDLNEPDVSVKVSGEVTVEKHVDVGNPNLDYYFRDDQMWREEYDRVTVNGREWEVEMWNATTEEFDLDRGEVLASARARASEDNMGVAEVLEEWVSLKYAPDAVEEAFNYVVWGDQ
jgi:hypothetical protein